MGAIADGNPIPIFDPSIDPSGRWTSHPHGNLKATSSRGSHLKLRRAIGSKQLPQPTFNGPLNNYVAQGVGSLWKANLNIFNARLDEYIGDKDHITVTIWASGLADVTPQSRLPDQISTDLNVYKHTWMNRLGWDHIFSPTLLNHFAGSYNHDYLRAGPHNRICRYSAPVRGVPNHEQPPV